MKELNAFRKFFNEGELNEAEQPYVVPGEDGGFQFNEKALEDYFSKTSFVDPNMGEEFFFAGPKAEKDADGDDLFLSLMGDPGFSQDINGILDGFSMGERYSKAEIEAALNQAVDFYLGVY